MNKQKRRGWSKRYMERRAYNMVVHGSPYSNHLKGCCVPFLLVGAAIVGGIAWLLV